MDAAYLSWLVVAMVLVGGIVGVTYVVRNDPIFQTANQFTDPSNAFAFAAAHRFLQPTPPPQDDKEQEAMMWGLIKGGVGVGLAGLMFAIHRVRSRSDTPAIDGADAVKTYETLMESERLKMGENAGSRAKFEKNHPGIRDKCMKATTKVHSDPGTAAAFRERIDEQSKYLRSLSKEFQNGQPPSNSDREKQKERSKVEEKSKGLADEILDGISGGGEEGKGEGNTPEVKAE